MAALECVAKRFRPSKPLQVQKRPDMKLGSAFTELRAPAVFLQRTGELSGRKAGK